MKATSVNHVSSHVLNGIGHIELDRPAALNALTTPMIADIHRALDEWDKARLTAIILSSADPKAFCAGGDIRQVRANTIAGDFEASEDFFRAEYRLNARIARHHTPIVSVIDGICMGGGLGLTMHGHVRVVTQNAVLAMPENAIGFFPDVGASYFLSRLPGALGMYLGLTGCRLDVRDALYTGLATHYVDTENVRLIADALGADAGADRPIDSTLRSLGTPLDAGDSTLARHRDEIDHTFGAPTLDGIIARLRDREGGWASQTLAQLAAASPQSLAVTHAVLARGRQSDVQQCLDTDFDVATSMVRTSDFVEGVRAGLVDKDRQPAWTSPQFHGFDANGRSTWSGLI